VTPDGLMAASGGWDKTIRVWDLEKGTCVRTLEGHRYRIASVTITADGKRVIAASWDQTLRVWDVETGQCLAIAHCETSWSAAAAAASADRIIAGTANGSLAVLDLGGLANCHLTTT